MNRAAAKKLLPFLFSIPAWQGYARKLLEGKGH